MRLMYGKKGDELFKSWLKGSGYHVLKTQVFKDCIGYRCNRNGYAYTIYMYAYGKTRKSDTDGEMRWKLPDKKFSKESTVLVTLVKVKRFSTGEDYEYRLCHYNGDENVSPELWRPNIVSGRKILEYYPRKEAMDALERLAAAFNAENDDMLDCVCSWCPRINDLKANNGKFFRIGYPQSLHSLHKEFGDMKIGLVRFGDAVYSRAPYLNGYGYFSVSVDPSTDKITEITAYPFEGSGNKIAEFIKVKQCGQSHWFRNIPLVTKVTALPPVQSERFALKLSFNNGACKKYISQISRKSEDKEVVSYRNHVFTDKIWQTATIVQSESPHRGMAIKFSNEFSLPVLLCYEEGTDYVEPHLETELKVVYQDDTYTLDRMWSWDAKEIHQDEETGFYKALVSGQAFNDYGLPSCVTPDGIRLCSIDFDRINGFSEGLAMVEKCGVGCGYVDKNMRFVIPMQYSQAEDFHNGYAKVKKDDDWIYIDMEGKETACIYSLLMNRYQDVGEYREGLCAVSTLKLDQMDLAYHSDYADVAGIWGFVDERGEEIIAPQYIYAEGFCNGMAIVCKGRWTIDKKEDNTYNSGKYWTEEELWGGIDKAGKEVIPFIFDDIQSFGFDDESKYFRAHIGGYGEGKGHWGVIDRTGNWVVPPQFSDIGYEYQDGLFIFSYENPWEDSTPWGIFDSAAGKILFDAQFFDITFMDDGWIGVKVFDEQLGRNIEKIIDRTGKERFHSVYTAIYSWEDSYVAVIRDANGIRRGLIDKEGNVILPCKYNVTWNGIYPEKQLAIYDEGGYKGIVSFDDQIFVAAKYLEISGLDHPFFVVRVGDKDNKGTYTEGLIDQNGNYVIMPKAKRIHWFKKNCIICEYDDHCEVFQLFSESKDS